MSRSSPEGIGIGAAAVAVRRDKDRCGGRGSPEGPGPVRTEPAGPDRLAGHAGIGDRMTREWYRT